MAPILRKARLNLRELLFGTGPEQEMENEEVSLTMEQGMVQHPKKVKKLSYGDLGKRKKPAATDG